jgi:hypothetical protein
MMSTSIEDYQSTFRMSATSNVILGHLQRVEAERARRQSDPELKARVEAVKKYQQQRFSLTYPDLLSSDRYRLAARFFLDELYGPRDFAVRDAQFAKVVPMIVRLFPRQLVGTVNALAELHDLSERLDSAMGLALTSAEVDANAYIRAWQVASTPVEREQQIALTVELGQSLDRLTRKPLLRKSLHMMRGPAAAAGLGDLQRLLEAGFDAFAAMRGAQDFLALVATRERALAEQLFAVDCSEQAMESGRVLDGGASLGLQ